MAGVRLRSEADRNLHEVSELIIKLIRTANDPGRQDRDQVSQLLYEAIVSITNLRRQAGIPAIGTKRDAIIGLRNIAKHPLPVADFELRAALLEAAEMLRTLRILVDSDVAITLHEIEMSE